MQSIGVLGSGTMGSGIIQVLAQNGYEVYYRARREESVVGGLETVKKNLDRMVRKERITEKERDEALARIHGSTELDILRGVDLIIESTTEDLESKKELFKALDALLDSDVILATNTSSLSITEIAYVTSRPEKVIGMHFFNPVPVMSLVEVIRGLMTSDETNSIIIDLSRNLGKTPVEVEEAAGFVVNRILIPMINEAVGILADGLASKEDIDEAMKLGANHPMGPLELGDLIGLDVVLAILNTMYQEYADPKYRPHFFLRKMVRAGKLGRKTGEGFYKYNK
ncbi:MAG: 3-hydroxybutyryl-CoA dehydrogenase [Firmicutes bacterium]|nr:3-hydroxybutyryl-CoA dehydrogenase [Bacillota bacterium]